MDGSIVNGSDLASTAILLASGRPKRVEWTNREEDVIREHFPSGGMRACMPLLPGRSESTIYQHAHKMGIYSTKQKRDRKRWTSTEHIDAAIRRVYQSDKLHSGVVVALAKTLVRPTWWVKKRAVHLGLTVPRFKESPWTEAEDELLRAHAHKIPEVIRKIFKRHGFTRTTTALVVRMKRFSVDRTDPDHFTANALAKCFGVDAKVIASWIAKGWLKAERRGTERTDSQGGDQWWIHQRDVRAFVIDNVAAVDLRKIADKEWFVDLLANGR